MAELAIILGNGFDLNLGLPSRYSDFIESREWEKLKKPLDTYGEDYLNHSLIYHLQNEANKKANWFDIEVEILRFINNHPECSENEIRDIGNEFKGLKKALKNYLIRVSDTHIINDQTIPCRFFDDMVIYSKNMVVINFNYTNPFNFLPIHIKCHYNTYNQTHVHGSLAEDEIVLGCDIQSGQQVNRSLSFMYKYNMLNRANHVANDLLEAKEIIFYGHSVNEMDFGYFRDFFKAASSAPKPIRNLTFITLDENSERSIKDNIRNQGISVTDLYNNLETFTFIHTNKMDSNDSKTLKKWEEMFDRI